MTRVLSFVFLLSYFLVPKSSVSQKDDGYVSMPSPLQIVMIFQSPDLKYDSTLVHSIKDVDNYTTNYKQVLNYGVYLADLAYCIQNKKYDDAVKYLHVLKIVGAKAKLNSYMDKYDLYSRFEKNLENGDSMMTILVDMSLSFEMILNEKSLMETVGIQFAGIWVEGAYIVSQLASFEAKESLNKVLVHQFPVLQNIVEVINSVKREGKVHLEFKQDLNDLLLAMSKMKTIKKFMKKKNDIPLTAEELKIIEEKLRRIRSKVIAAG